MSDKSPEAIRAEIEETREKLSEDLDELSYRFSPEGLKDKAHDTMEGAQDVLTGATQGMVDSLSERVEGLNHSLLERIRDNPLPATLLGAGVSWLLMQAAQGDSSRESGQSYGRAASYVNDPERAGGAVLDSSGELVYRTRPQGSSGLQNPLVVGVGVLVAGLAVGLLIPGPRTPRRGEANRGLMSNAGRNARATRAGRTVRPARVTTGGSDRDTRGATQTGASASDSSAYDFDADREYYRAHHGDAYTDSGFSYEDVEPAYRYGATLRSEEAYRDRTWDDTLEAELRSRWESEQRASWDTFGSAVRHGYERPRRR